MATIEELKEGISVIGIIVDRPVTIIHVKWFGQQAVELTFKDEQTGKLVF